MLKPSILLVTAPVKQTVTRAVQERRIGNLSADRGLDILTFFVADIQTGFGPLIASYLTAQHWTSERVGQVLGIGYLVGIIAQVPAGAAIDASPLKRAAALVALVALGISALLLASFPSWWPVVAAEALHGLASCLLLPALAAISLTRVGRRALAERLGRNARFMALGAALSAPLLGLAYDRILPAAAFWLVAFGTLPALLALMALPPRHPTEPRPQPMPSRAAAVESKRVLLNRRLIVFLICVVLFHAANAFMLPLAISMLQVRIGGHAGLWLAACQTGPQFVVAAASPWIGRLAERWGRKPLLIGGFALLPLRGVLLAFFPQPELIVAVQMLDGVGGAMFGVMQPLIASDLTRGTNRFNLVLGLLGLMAGLGGALSGTYAGWIASHYGGPRGFFAMAAVGAVATAAVLLLMPETRPLDQDDPRPADPGASTPSASQLATKAGQ